MAVHRKTATLTVASSGDGIGHDEEDLNVFPISSRLLLTRLLAVEYEGDQLDLTVSELDEADEDDEDAVDTPGAMLLHVFETEDRFYYVLGANAVDQDGEAVSGAYQGIPITVPKVRVEVDGPPGSIATVKVYYETAGDQRF